ncbi:curli biogenesis system outer membrane secretion channel CsgG [Wenyingzhuangia heitensis]|uniref:Curli biogenesis system outer membrane secretion channel CsgG n=1 Tax=Wenyingzhuangia heitensis TaxID=1487859 RepID=A0ABX0U520_9FLAO|nr:CsgG/HfaB family protein [Wenyingzhuangia heitensis]NIJ43954.1 curli biogenesis system outer membrane secretion channel CsgG [Wenyingzhuangia heitensis]
MKKIFYSICFLIIISCNTSQKIIQTPAINAQQSVELNNIDQQFLKRKVAIARFSNETQYAKGLFYDKKNDPIGKQALDILSTKLTSSGKFILLERESLDLVLKENEYNQNFQKIGADYIIVGSVTEYGRKHIGDVDVFSNSKSQIVEAGVSLRLIDASTGQIIYSEEAKGEASTTTKNVMGLGKHAGYDSSLADKAISTAISKLVENIINNCSDRPWKSYILSYDENGIIISGGKSQNLKAGMRFNVNSIGKKLKNPQTGLMIQLPGKKVAEIEVTFTGGESEGEFSIVNLVSGSINKDLLNTYEVLEIK